MSYRRALIREIYGKRASERKHGFSFRDLERPSNKEFFRTYDFLLKATVTLCREGMLCNTLQKDPFCLFLKKRIHNVTYFEQLYGMEVVNVNTVNIDPSVVKSDNPHIKGKKKGWKKAYVTFTQKYEMDWSAYEGAPALLFNVGQKNDAKKKAKEKQETSATKSAEKPKDIISTTSRSV
ncbi:hypothetical protein RFI_31528 [Reticulomyxa filosa]|uniref:Uncharacterized protein n=1 Tax=Reticulomyxa filosa TaxID=46433 RepID=X6LVE7_RETFI|nr:hypothetical protein RFI_31528 [Reticulomyxa filosa]|eukprot:ETO05868.1 hypothetical protein RFI_31528 [Reticulomyxa filosa]